MAQTIAVTLANYAELLIRGKVAYHADVTINESGSAKDLTGITALKLELKAPDDHDGTAISTVALTIDNALTGELDIDITDVNTEVIQDSGETEGIFDAIGTLGGDVILLFHGDWRLEKGVTD